MDNTKLIDFSQCDTTCTADCGHCKGGLVEGSPRALEAVKAESHDHEFEDRCYCGLTAADHFAEGDTW